MRVVQSELNDGITRRASDYVCFSPGIYCWAIELSTATLSEPGCKKNDINSLSLKEKV
jgi:hypothetical protein